MQVTTDGRAVEASSIDDDGHVTASRATSASVDDINCEAMRQLSAVGVGIDRDQITVRDAAERIATARAHRSPWWWTIGGGALLSLGVAIQVDPRVSTAIVAVIAYLASAFAGRGLGRLGVPRIFSVAMQAVIATGVAVAAVVLANVPLLSTIAAVAVVWMLLIPLPQLIGAVVDAVNRDVGMAGTRFVSFALACTGVTIGAIIAVTIARSVVGDDAAALDLVEVPMVLGLVFCVAGAVGNALANSGGVDLLLPAAIIGLLTGACNIGLQQWFGVSSEWSAPITAVALGVAVQLAARRWHYSSTALALVGITGALLPGLTVTRAFVDVIEGADPIAPFVGVAGAVFALGIAIAFGFLLATFVERGSRRHHRISEDPTIG